MRLTIMIIIVSIVGIFTSCKKYLDAKPDKKLSTASTLKDLQALMDRTLYVNYTSGASLEAAADNYYVSPSIFATLPEYHRNMYAWNYERVFPDFGSTGNEWSVCFDNVYRANTVLQNIEKIDRSNTNSSDWDNIKGQALLLRGKCFLQALWTWSLAYDEASSHTDLGIPLRMTTDFNQPSVRANVTQSYNQVIRDFKEAIPLLPPVAVHPVRASRAAAYGFLARTYLSMRNYELAGKYADSCLAIRSDLIDYNSPDITLSASIPFKPFNKEVIYENGMSNSQLLYASVAIIDSNLYRSYDDNDLRKAAFFGSNSNGTYYFRGTYNDQNLFNGIATDEIYLTRAECTARKNEIQTALEDLNKVMNLRWKTGTYIPYTATTTQECLQVILTERRKELVMRGLRWMDLKRFNKEGMQITLLRKINNDEFRLVPNDPRYAMAIPEQVIAASAMPQNPR